jgi:hypothetical protein
MDKSIKYVREHCIATLLNDMVTHIVLKKPAEPLGCLIDYLQNEKSSPSRLRNVVAKNKEDRLPGTDSETLDEILRNEIALYERLAAADVTKLDKDVVPQVLRARGISAANLQLLSQVATDKSVKDTLATLLGEV